MLSSDRITKLIQSEQLAEKYQFASTWLSKVVEGLSTENFSPPTLEKYRTSLRLYLEFCYEHKKSLCTREAHEGFHQYLKQRTLLEPEKQYACGIAWSHLKLIQTKMGVTTGLSNRSPVSYKQYKPTEALTEDQFSKAVRIIRGLYDAHHAIVEKAVKSGDIESLTMRHTKKERYTISVKHNGGNYEKPLVGMLLSQWMVTAFQVLTLHTGTNASVLYNAGCPRQSDDGSYTETYVDKKRANKRVRVAFYDTSENGSSLEFDASLYRWFENFMQLRKVVCELLSISPATLLFRQELGAKNFRNITPLQPYMVKNFRRQYKELIGDVPLTSTRLRTTLTQNSLKHGGFSPETVAKRNSHNLETSQRHYRAVQEAVGKEELAIGTMVLSDFINTPKGDQITIKSIREQMANKYEVKLLTPQEASDAKIKTNVTGLGCRSDGDSPAKKKYLQRHQEASCCADFKSCWECPNAVMISDEHSIYLLLSHKDYLTFGEVDYLPYRLKNSSIQVILDKIEEWLTLFDPALVERSQDKLDREGNFFDNLDEVLN